MLYVILELVPLLCHQRDSLIYLIWNLLLIALWVFVFLDSTINKTIGRIDDILTVFYDNYVPIDFLVLDIECGPSCPIILGRPFLCTIGDIIDMKEGTIRFQFPLKKGIEHFPRNKIKLPFESTVRTSYSLDVDKTWSCASCLAKGMTESACWEATQDIFTFQVCFLFWWVLELVTYV